MLFRSFALTRSVFSERSALWASVCAAVIGGDYFLRSSLGFTDHHCAEVLLTTTALAFTAKACSATDARQARRLSAAAGLSLGAYLLTWGGGSLFVAVLVVWAAMETLIAHAQGGSGRPLVRIVATMFGLAAVMILPWWNTRPTFGYDLMALALGASAIPAIDAIAAMSVRRGYSIRSLLTVVGLIGLVASALVWLAIQLVVPDLIWQMGQIGRAHV